MYSLSSNGAAPLPSGSALTITGRPVKFQEAPPFPVERKTKNALEMSTFGETAAPRLNSWQAM